MIGGYHVTRIVWRVRMYRWNTYSIRLRDCFYDVLLYKHYFDYGGWCLDWLEGEDA